MADTKASVLSLSSFLLSGLSPESLRHLTSGCTVNYRHCWAPYHLTCLPRVQPVPGKVRELKEGAHLSGTQKIQRAAGGLNSEVGPPLGAGGGWGACRRENPRR